MERRILIIIAVLTGLLIIGGALWLILSIRGEEPQGGETATEDFFGGERDVVGERVGDRTPSEIDTSSGGSGVSLVPKLFSIHDKAIAGSALFGKLGKTYARFMEEESGHVYEMDLISGEKKRVSNTTIPAVERAEFSNDGNVVLFQFYESGLLRSAIAGLSSSTSTSAGFSSLTFLPDRLETIALSPSGKDVFYLARGGEGMEGFVRSNAGGNFKKVFSSPFRGWKASWEADNAIILSLKPGEGGGMVIRINPQTGASSVLGTGATFGAAIASRNASVAGIVAVSGDSAISLRTLQDGELGDVSFFDTVPDKCAFVATSTSLMLCALSTTEVISPALSLTPWYTGLSVDSNELWILNFREGSRTLVLGTEDMGDLRFDMLDPKGAGLGSFSLFIDKQSRTLWGVRP